jgi:hypothetical protein
MAAGELRVRDEGLLEGHADALLREELEAYHRV